MLSENLFKEPRWELVVLVIRSVGVDGYRAIPKLPNKFLDFLLSFRFGTGSFFTYSKSDQLANAFTTESVWN
jgi:hypothetical protein